MRRSRTRNGQLLVALALCVLAVPACAYRQVPTFDPSGQYIFAQPGAVAGPPMIASPPTAAAPGAIVAVPDPISAGPAAAPPVVAAPPAAALPSRAAPRQPSLWDDVAVNLNPVRTIAPIGSEVVLLAGVKGGDGYLRTNRRLEWTIAPGSVGQFVAIGDKTVVDLLVGDFNFPRIVTGVFAIGSTSRRYIRLEPRRPGPNEPVGVAAGQGWITVTSPVEGTSVVTVTAPEVVTWNGRTRSAVIQWVDPSARTVAPGPAAATVMPGPVPGPRPGPTPAVPSGRLEVNVTGPTEAAVGSQVTFQIVVTNRSQSSAKGLVIKDRFEEGLQHEVAKSPIERDLGDLEPGQQSRPIAVTFRVVKPGRWCQRVEVTAADGASARGEGCVVATEAGAGPEAKPGGPPTPAAKEPSPLRVQKTGPAEREVGQNAEFTIEINNNGARPLTNVRVVDTFDRSMALAKASEGASREWPSLVWSIPSLAAGGMARLQIECECRDAAEKACNRVTVTCQEGFREEAEACLVVRAAAKPEAPTGGLKLTVAELQNPVAVRTPVTYVVRVTNTASTPDRDVHVSVAVPQGISLDPLKTRGPEGTGVRFRREGDRVVFDAIRDLPPGMTLDYRVTVTPRQPGALRVEAQAASRNQAQPVAQEKSTDVFLPSER